MQQINRRYYVYPSHYIGQYGAYDALRFLFSQGGMEHLIKKNSILVSREHVLHDIEECRLKVKEDFYSKNNIEKNSTLIYFCPGNTIGETEYSLEDFRRGYNEFVLKYSSPTSMSKNSPPKSKYVLIVSIHKGTDSEKAITDFINQNKFETRIILVNNEDNSHYSGMCASDFGFVYNGQMLSAAAALHLNVYTMQNMNDLHYFWHTWENRWLADINVNADRPIIPEFAAGEYWFGNIESKLATMHTNTDLRWDQVRALNPFITEMLSIKNSELREALKDKDHSSFDEYVDPIYLMSEKISKSIESYKSKGVTPNFDILKSVPSIKLNNSLLSNI